VRHVLHLFVLLSMLVLTGPRISSAQSAQVEAPLDLSAMMLTPADLEKAGLEGYGIRGGWTDTLDDELVGLLAGGSLGADEVEAILSDPGLIRSRVLQLDLPSMEDPDYTARRVTLYIDEYTNNEGLDDVIELYTSLPNTEELEGEERIGDQSRLISYTAEGDGYTSTGMMLAFSLDNLLGLIDVQDFDDYRPDIAPEIGEIESLALLLEEQMADVVDGGGPGLDSRVLRLESDGSDVRYYEDFYTRIDEESLANYGETEDQIEEHQDVNDVAGVIDAYSVEQQIGSDGQGAITFRSGLRSFEDEDAASAWLQDPPELADVAGDQPAAEDVSGLGDEAITWSFTTESADPERTEDAFWTATAIRSGADVALVLVARWGDQLPADIVDELLVLQEECLDEATCTGEAPAPDELLELAAEDVTGSSNGPTDEPSEEPTDEPTEEPTDEPSDRPTGADLLDRVETFDDLSNQHTEDPVDYAQVPPAGGMHNPVPQTCGFYDEPIGSEHAVHSLEHGAVWVTYDPDLPANDVQVLEDLAAERDYLIVSPFAGLPAPVVASAWGVQLRLEGVDDPYLELFVDYYEQGPQTPELGAACSGTDETIS